MDCEVSNKSEVYAMQPSKFIQDAVHFVRIITHHSARRPSLSRLCLLGTVSSIQTPTSTGALVSDLVPMWNVAPSILLRKGDTYRSLTRLLHNGKLRQRSKFTNDDFASTPPHFTQGHRASFTCIRRPQTSFRFVVSCFNADFQHGLQCMPKQRSCGVLRLGWYKPATSVPYAVLSTLHAKDYNTAHSWPVSELGRMRRQRTRSTENQWHSLIIIRY